MALTATATSFVQSKIVSQLGLRDPFVAKTSFNRWNLHYSVSERGSEYYSVDSVPYSLLMLILLVSTIALF